MPKDKNKRKMEGENPGKNRNMNTHDFFSVIEVEET